MDQRLPLRVVDEISQKSALQPLYIVNFAVSRLLRKAAAAAASF